MIQKINKKLLLVLIDILFVFLAYFLIIFVAREDYLEFFLSAKTLNSIVIMAFGFFLALNIVKFYSYIWVYTGVKEYFFCFMGCLLADILLTILSALFKGHFLPPKYMFTAGILSTSFVVGSRASVKVIYTLLKGYYRETEKNLTNLLVIGAGDAAALAIRQILREYGNKYHIVGSIDDDIRKSGNRVYGVKVLGTREDIKKVSKKYGVDEILFAIPSCSDRDKHEILDICSETGCKLRVMPGNIAFMNRIELKKDIRDIQVEDLLQRDRIELDEDKISNYIKGNVALVTGGGGSIGSELCRQIARYSPKQLIIVDIYENNAYDIQNELLNDYKDLKLEVLIASVRDIERLDKIFEKYKPDVVFHAAAHKHVPLMEDSSGEAIKNNVKGTLNTCICADKHKVKKFVLISTDKAVNPTNIMGASKRICEMIVQAINEKSETEFVAVRFGNVLGSNGSVVPLFKKQIENGGPVTVTHQDITRYFMLIPEAAQLVLEAATFAKGGEIFVLDMGKPVRIYDLATKMIKLSGFEIGKDIEIKITGLRPGEKLYEELLMSEEGLASTANKKIFVGKPSHVVFENLVKDIDKLMELAQSESTEELRNKMKEVVPTFKEEFLSKIAKT